MSVSQVIEAALAEDLRWGPDATTEATVDPDAVLAASVVARAPGVLAGVSTAGEVYRQLAVRGSAPVRVQPSLADGARVAPGETVLEVAGSARSVLTGERTMLNLLCQLSGVATLTNQWVQAVAGTRAQIRDTRKTVPGLRELQKYAVQCGGGVNHRLGLGDAALIKDNHIAAAGSFTAALSAVRSLAPGLVVEVECDTIDQVREAIAAGAGLLLLDNMSIADLRVAVSLAAGTGVQTEASGGLRLEDAAEIAASGVDYLAVGALTHSAPALDLGLDVIAAGADA